jgi:CBS domain containing-hemolysin-like protein
MVTVFVIVAVVLVVFGGLLAAVDSALGVLSRGDLHEEAEASPRSRKALLAIADDVGAHVNAVNFMRIVAETSAAVLVSLSFATAVDQWWLALLLSALIMTVVSFVLVGSSPRSVGRAHARGLVVVTAGLVRAVRLVLGPLADALVAVGNRVTPGRPRTASFSSEEQLLSMVDEATELDVREVMVPRTDMVTVEATATMGSAMSLFLGRGVSRVPVVGRDSDDVVGVVYLRDLARRLHEHVGDDSAPVVGLARPALFVPESKKADDTLRQMQVDKNHLAMVVDEYGGIAGLVTLEDLIEELVGDISDEYDRTVAAHREVSPGVFRVSARLPVDELGDLFGIELDDDDVDSVGGLLTKNLGRLPEKGSVVTVSGLVLTADRTEGRRHDLQTVLVERSLDPSATVAAPAPATTREAP